MTASTEVGKRVDGFTLVFEGDLSAFKGNPFHVETPFGKPHACGLGNAFEREDEAVAAVDALFEALTGLMAVFPPSGRTREQMDAFAAAGKAIAAARDF
jgi:hypothetical protein